MDQLQSFIEGLGTVDWLIIGVILFLAAGTAPVKALAAKAWSAVPSVKLPNLAPANEPESVLELIEKLKARRAGLAAEIARIDELLGVKRSD